MNSEYGKDVPNVVSSLLLKSVFKSADVEFKLYITRDYFTCAGNCY